MKDFRINERIRCPKVRLVKDGQQLGIVSVKDAQMLARDMGLDLVEVAPQANPPVCHILDYGKFKYDKKKKEKESKKNQKEVEIKELRLRPGIAQHDLDTKINQAINFLKNSKRVQLVLRYKNREIAHKEEGFKVIDSVIHRLEPVGTVVQKPSFQGRQLICLLEPRKV